MTDEIRAAGGAVWRHAPDGTLEIVLVHRPRHGDWSLPKGKAKRSETDEDCALREVEEETGLACELGPELPSAEYVVEDGRPKRVRYWAMWPAASELRPVGEVDEARWVPLADAGGLLSYDHDRAVLDALAALDL